MLALTIRQPWAHFVVFSGKRIENRTWPTKFRGDFLIHAAAALTRDEYDEGLRFALGKPGLSRDALPAFEQLARGVIVGRARLVDCSSGPQRGDEDPWSLPGQYGFRLDDVRELPFARCRGALGFWEVPVEVLAQLRLGQGG